MQETQVLVLKVTFIRMQTMETFTTAKQQTPGLILQYKVAGLELVTGHRMLQIKHFTRTT